MNDKSDPMFPRLAQRCRSTGPVGCQSDLPPIRAFVLASTALALAACSGTPTPPKPLTVETVEDQPVQFDLSLQSPREAGSTYVIEKKPKLGKLSGTAPLLTFTPLRDFHGDDSFSYSVVNEDGEKSAPVSVNIRIEWVNDRPTVQPLTLRILEDSRGTTEPVGRR